MRNTGGHLLPQFIGKALAFLIIADAHFGGDGEARRHRKADARHFSQVRALAAKQVLVARLAFRNTAAEAVDVLRHFRSEEHTSELQSLMRISYAVFCLKKKKNTNK